MINENLLKLLILMNIRRNIRRLPMEMNKKKRAKGVHIREKRNKRKTEKRKGSQKKKFF